MSENEPELDGETLSLRACKLGLLSETHIEEMQDRGEWESDGRRLMRLLERKGLLTPFQTEKLLKGDTTGFSVGGYRLLYKIASGTFGRVFRADDPRTGMNVAIKILRQRWSEKSEWIELFEREGRVGLTLRHPNIVEILAVDHDAVSKQHYIVMEFVEGGNLRDFISTRKKVPPVEALRLTAEAAAGLAHAHSRKVAHRDIKPTNMLISSQGALKLVDFGLACLYEAGGNVRADGRMQPTVDYAGLEKVTGATSGDPRSDIYFLGCVLYEMLSGRPPLDMTKDKNARQARQRFDAVVPLGPKEVPGPASLFRVLTTMMALDPMDRFQSPQDVYDAVSDVRRELTGLAAASAAGLTGPPRTVFVLEPHEKLQDAIRTKLKEQGYRVLISGDPNRAVQRFQEQPYDALIVDAGSTGAPGLDAFRTILNEADYRKREVVGVLMLSEEQKDWPQKVATRCRTAALTRPITLRQLHETLRDLLTQSPA